jgi:hypothetical protein
MPKVLNPPTDYTWRALACAFTGTWQTAQGNTSLVFRFDTRTELGWLDWPQNNMNNPQFQISADKSRLIVSGGVTLPRQGTDNMGAVTFVTADNGITTWTWTLDRTSEKYRTSGAGLFVRSDLPDPHLDWLTPPKNVRLRPR